MKINLYISILLFLICSNSVYAQSNTGIKKIDTYLLKQKTSTNETTTKYKIVVYLNVIDTLDINKIKISLIDSTSSPNINYQRLFNYDYFGVLSDSTKYSRKGTSIKLELGKFSDIHKLYVEASIQNKQNSFLPALKQLVK